LELWVDELWVDEVWVDELWVDELWDGELWDGELWVEELGVEELDVEDRWEAGPALDPLPNLATTRPASAPTITRPSMVAGKRYRVRVGEVSTSFCPEATGLVGSGGSCL
jgi:hypothetical protein